MSAHSRRRRRWLSEEDLWEWKHLAHASESAHFMPVDEERSPPMLGRISSWAGKIR
jgi:hypothetical protein